MDKKLEDRKKVSASQQRFMAKTGMTLGFSDDQAYKTIGFNDIYGNENCSLYFSELQLPQFKGK